jgi:hypothetical protein
MASLTLGNAIIYALSNSMPLNHANNMYSKTTIYIMKTTHTNTTRYKYAYVTFPEPLASLTQVAVSQTQIAESQTQITDSQTQIAMSQTQIFESPRLCNHAPMQYAPKTIYDNTPKSTNIQYQFHKHHLQYSKPPTVAQSHTIHSKFHIL